MNLHIPEYLFSFMATASAVLLVAVLSLVWFGVARMPSRWSERIMTAGFLSLLLLVWFVLAQYLGRQNVYWAPNNPTGPTIAFGIFMPMIIGLVLLARSQHITRLVDALPMSWVVGVQVYRNLGFIFLVLWWDGHLPWQFALPAGIGDIATGVLALVVAGMLISRVSGAHRTAYAWCLFGIADLVVAVTMGVLTSPGLTHFVALDAPNLLVTAYPLVIVPTFAVPLSILLHGACLWKLRRRRSELRTSEAGRGQARLAATSLPGT